MSGKRKAEQPRAVGKTLDEALGVAAAAPQGITVASSVSASSAPRPPAQGDSVVRALMGAVVTATRATNALPAAEGGGGTNDFEYFKTHRALNAEFRGLEAEISDIIRDLCSFSRPGPALPLLSGDLLDPLAFDAIVDVIDDLLESADVKLDMMSEDANKASGSIRDAVDRERIMQSQCLLMDKPQLVFKDGPAENSRDAPFAQKVSLKVNASVPLDRSLAGPGHVYDAEISALRYDSRSIVDYVPVGAPLPPPAYSEQPFQLVDTVSGLVALAQELKGVEELAVDLENHSLRSFQGFSCVMQLSTRSKDYVIDTMLLRSEMHRLLDVFTDPNVVKVFHGCDHDVEWLQRDFGLFVVNCFDTHQAAKLLGFPALSLAHLLKFYCGVTANKKYQLADWRQRPIPREMLHYAREDTHYLLYIYDCLRRDVLNSHDKTGLCSVFEASKRICLKKYEKEVFVPSGYMKLLSSNRVGAALATKGLNATQDCVLAAAWNWRDLLARDLDESPSYIMTNSELLKFGVRFRDFLPASESELAACVPNMSEIAKSHLSDLLRDIELNANGQSIIESEPKKAASSVESARAAAGSEPRKVGKTLVNARGPASGALARLQGMQDEPFNFEPVPRLSAQSVASNKPSVPTLGNGKHSTLSRGTPSPGEIGDVSDITELKQLFDYVGWVSRSTSRRVEANREAKSYTYVDEPLAATRDAYSRARQAVAATTNLSAAFDNALKSTSRSAAALDDSDVPLQSRDTTDRALPMEIMSDSRTSNDLEQSQQDESNAANDGAPTGLPKSLADIYGLSNFNRKNRNRAKKRNKIYGDSASMDASLSASGATATETGSAAALGSEGGYFEGAASKCDGNSDETLSYAQGLGWIGEQSKNAFKIARQSAAAAEASASALSAPAPSTAQAPPRHPGTKQQQSAQQQQRQGPSVGSKETAASNVMGVASNPFIAFGALGNTKDASKGSAPKHSTSASSAAGPRKAGMPSGTNAAPGTKPSGKASSQQQQQHTKIEQKKDRDRTYVFS